MYCIGLEFGPGIGLGMNLVLFLVVVLVLVLSWYCSLYWAGHRLKHCPGLGLDLGPCLFIGLLFGHGIDLVMGHRP